MSLEFRVPSPRLTKPSGRRHFDASKWQTVLRLIQRSAPEMLKLVRSVKPTSKKSPPVGIVQGPKLEGNSGESKAEAVFDTEFLKQLERLRLIAKRLSWAGAKGEHPSSRKGFSLEFSDYRTYQQGDDLRYVDWNIYRRLERVLLKVFTAEEEMNVYLLVDISRSMAEGSPAKIEYARKLAAALGYIGLKNLDRVGGAAFSSDLHSTLTLGRGRKQILSLFDFLGRLSCAGETDLLAAVRSFTRLFPHPGLVVLVSDLLDPRGARGGLEELARKKHDVLVIHVLNRDELNPGPLGDIALLDIERDRERRFYVDPDLVRRYQEEFSSFLTEIEGVCGRRKIDYLRTTTEKPFDQFVLDALRQIRTVA
jgi:uncharacterized protein (DUF58 family)